MKISEYTNKDFGRAFKRISLAFRTHFPSNVEWVDSNPDIEIVQVVGKKEYDYLTSKNSLKNVVMHQQCLLTTGIPISDWVKLWKECKLVMSFHDLKGAGFNFLRTPLGAEPDTFPVGKVQRVYDVFSTGHVAETECLDMLYNACVMSQTKMLHTGENFKWNAPNYQFLEYMNDPWYSSVLQRTKYVTGLRRVEGFEMACIEGAMSGAVPIVPFLPTYDYYKDFGLYIFMDGDITDQLINIFDKSYVPLTQDQLYYVRDEFSWKNICEKIYKRLIYD
jgi:hypothetical protein